MTDRMYIYEIRQIDAWNEGNNNWTYNDSFHIAEFKTRSEDHKRAFLNALKKYGIVCKRGKCRIDFDGYIYELQDRKTGEPLIAAIPVNF